MRFNIMILGIFILMISGSTSLFAEEVTFLELREGWEYRTPQGVWQPFTLLPESSESTQLTLRKKLPEDLPSWPEPVLFLPTLYGAFAVYLEDQKLYEFVGEDLSSPKLYYPYYYHLLPLPQDYGGKQLILNIYSNYLHIGPKSSPELGNRSDILRVMLYHDLDRLIASTLFLGIALLLFYLGWKSSDRLTYIVGGLFSLSGTFLCFNFSLAKQLWVDAPLFFAYSQYLASYTAAVTIFIFAERVIGYSLLLHRLWQINLIFALSTWVMIPVFPIYISALAYFLFCVLGMLAMFVSVITKAWQGHLQAKIMGFGFSAFALVVIFDMLIQVGWVSWLRSVGHWGQLILTLCMMKSLKSRGQIAEPLIAN